MIVDEQGKPFPDPILAEPGIEEICTMSYDINGDLLFTLERRGYTVPLMKF